MPQPDVLLIEGSDFDSFPAGGQLSMARSLMKIFPGRLALVGIGSSPEHGRWTTKQIGGIRYPFFPAAYREPSPKKPLIPARASFYAALRRHREGILSSGCRAAFLQSPEVLLAVSAWGWESLCFRFAGTENPLNCSRYWYAKPLGRYFDHRFFSALERVSVVVATGDEDAMKRLFARSKGRLAPERLCRLPTAVDTAEFRPVPLEAARARLGIPERCPVFVTSGRIGRLKGWELVVEAFAIFVRDHPDALLIFVGDGEERPLLEARISAKGLAGRIRVTGFRKPAEIAAYLNAANAVVFASYLEGWCTAMLEALACGKPVVSTTVSGAADMIRTALNGFIVADRDPERFARAMKDSVRLPDAERVSTTIAAEFDLEHLGERLKSAWPRLNGCHAEVSA
jgi:glycosyltransferase involved in cell wall biosynthesis